ncbi:hypothetical protein PGT21_021411 [Puccinia graminis f. sp. tritici]|uniref:Uncharacterized protein n=1 Tax=Puccinia graminis f. sp. tritici TaxID=56615 RepID=A0A5B0NNK7_PUCGR|nr:hypothetical protein PGT21_021064 [Puccinia graminis f. sp. tritici]KAA1093018.1 hypothetical protein PGT21_021411 [Puccinia graminis f. sp. tritici]KAA1107860.1 hypothetical protein PGTUg99_027323 [Puccinia graminis f. sp. tritici]KAA1115653.1 hypothetical protein PGTUg99_021324 [Puccinia graminis f. sp. tritici]
MVTWAIQALVNQGTIVISPKGEGRFALPNVLSLGPKIIQIILIVFLLRPSGLPCRLCQSYPQESCLGKALEGCPPPPAAPTNRP